VILVDNLRPAWITGSDEHEQGNFVDGFTPLGGSQQQQPPKEPVKRDRSGGTGVTLLVGALLLVFVIVVIGLLYLVFAN
jgi:hypothetical protein